MLWIEVSVEVFDEISSQRVSEICTGHLQGPAVDHECAPKIPVKDS